MKISVKMTLLSIVDQHGRWHAQMHATYLARIPSMNSLNPASIIPVKVVEVNHRLTATFLAVSSCVCWCGVLY